MDAPSTFASAPARDHEHGVGALDGVHEQAIYWRAEDLGNLDLLRATFVKHAFARHTHEGFAIGVIDRGAEAFRYRGATHRAPAGSIVLINPGEAHTGQAAVAGGWSYSMLYPDAKLLRAVATELAGRECAVPYFPDPVVYDPSQATLLRRLHALLERSDATLERESQLLAVCAHLLARHAAARPEPQAVGSEPGRVALARSYLEAHLEDNVNLDELARLTNLSPFHLLRVFQREVGLPPHAYLTQLRVGRAKQLLAAGMPLPQVAHVSGFSDQSHLTRQFKRLVGVTPGRYATGSARK
jgi:AraC-like DNA-binding protein